MMADLASHFMYCGERYEVEWFDLDEKYQLENIAWQQVYAIGDVNGNVPIVQYENPKFEPDNLPGGKTEPNETAEQTLVREMEEELNMRVLAWQPLGYQKVSAPNGETANQLRVYAKLTPIGPFVSDPGGNIIGHRLVAPQNVNEIIQYGEIGERMMRRAGKYFEDERSK
jgi:hypothetical protein